MIVSSRWCTHQQLGQADQLHITGYGGTRRVVQFLPFPGSSANGGGAVVDLTDDSRGGGARWIHSFSAVTPLDLIMGIEYDRLHELRKGWVNADGALGNLRRNEDDISSQAGEYYGQGFETPALSEFAYWPDGQAGFNEPLRPSTSRDYEAGLKGAWTRTKFDLAAFRITTADDIIVAASNDGRDSYANVASTRRRGLELSVTQTLRGDFDAYLAYTWLQARFGGGPSDGKSMPGVPRQMLYGALDWRYRPLGFSTTLSATWRDRVYTDNQNTAAADGDAVLNYRLGFERNTVHWRVREFASISNLLGRHYIGAVVVNTGNGRAFQPAPGRNFMLGLSASYAF